MKKVLITDSLAPAGKTVLTQAGLEVIELLKTDGEELTRILPEIQGWIIRSGTTITANKLEQAVKLEVIGRAGVGVDNIDIPAATAQGVVVMNTPGGNTVSAAEHTFAMLLALARNIPAGDLTTRSGEWRRKELMGTELYGKTLGILGLGRIGQEVARRALGFQMKVIGYDPYVTAEQLMVRDIAIHDLDFVIRQADVLTLHLPRNKDTLNLISTQELEQMPAHALLINCARGGLVNEANLAVALDQGVIAGAAVDVYLQEPPVGNPLLKARNIVLTPHLGASTREAGEKVAVQVATQIKDFLLEKRLINTVNSSLV